MTSPFGRRASQGPGTRVVRQTTPRNQRRSSWAPRNLLAHSAEPQEERPLLSALRTDPAFGSKGFDIDTGRQVAVTVSEGQRRASNNAIWDAVAGMRQNQDLTENLKDLKWIASGHTVWEKIMSSDAEQSKVSSLKSSRTPTPPPVSAPTTRPRTQGMGEVFPLKPPQSAPSGWPEKPQVIDETYKQNLSLILSELTKFSMNSKDNRRDSNLNKLDDANNEVTNKIDQELARLRPQLRTLQISVAAKKRELKALRDTEIREKRDLWARQVEADEHLLRVVIRLQRSFRGYMVRKQIMNFQQGEQHRIDMWVSSLPRQLANHMYNMRLDIFKLRYRDCDRLSAVLRLQSWWRTLLVRRAAVVIKCAAWMRLLYDKMEQAAVTVQCRFRSRTIRKSFLGLLRAKMAERKERQVNEMLEANFHIIRIQRRFRLKLSNRRMQQMERSRVGSLAHRMSVLESVRQFVRQASMESIQAKHTVSTHLMDSWCPRKSVVEKTPAPNAQIESLKDAGQVPFYSGSAARQLPRHHIGGSFALDAQLALRLSSANGSSGRDLILATGDATIAREASIVLDKWNFYPHGDSFRPASSGVASLGDFAANNRRLPEKDGKARMCTTSILVQPSYPRRPRRTKPLNGSVPSNTKQRARRHRLGQCADSADVAAHEDVPDSHPLLMVSEPSPPPMTMSSPRPPEIASRPRPVSLVRC